MTYLAISVDAASRILLQRSLFDTGARGAGIIDLLKRGEVTKEYWQGFKVACTDLTCVAIPRDRVESVLLAPIAEFANVGTDDDLLRIADRTLRVFVTVARGSSPNKSWHAFKTGSLLSIFANPNRESERRRICFDLSQKQEHGIISLYAIRPLDMVEPLEDNPPSPNFVADLERLVPRVAMYFRAAELIPSVRAASIIEDHYTSTEYRKAVAENIALNKSYPDWEESLDAKQVDFVHAQVTGPKRLHGAAGTGKTHHVTDEGPS